MDGHYVNADIIWEIKNPKEVIGVNIF